MIRRVFNQAASRRSGWAGDAVDVTNCAEEKGPRQKNKTPEFLPGLETDKN